MKKAEPSVEGPAQEYFGVLVNNSILQSVPNAVKSDLIGKLLILRAQATLLRGPSECGLPVGLQSLKNLERVTQEFFRLLRGAA
jgi:hypothetical protein